MTISPIRCSIEVKLPPPRTFELFTRRMGDWWPKGMTPAPASHVDVVIEPHEGGRWYERDAQGRELQWGVVLAYEPPSRLMLGWQLNCDWRYDPTLLTEVELTFTRTDSGGTLVSLEHRDLERFGTDAARHADRIRNGWPTRLRDFVEYTLAMA